MIRFDEALDRPLFTVPLSLFNANQEKEQTGSDAYVQSNEENTDASKENTTYVVDLVALMRVVMAIPENFENLALKLMSNLPNEKISTS